MKRQKGRVLLVVLHVDDAGDYGDIMVVIQVHGVHV
jgi:hypothetical protein